MATDEQILYAIVKAQQRKKTQSYSQKLKENKVKNKYKRLVPNIIDSRDIQNQYSGLLKKHVSNKNTKKEVFKRD